jgi:hypothetical protein
MPSFKLIKPYSHRYKGAENSLQHHAQLKQTKSKEKAPLEVEEDKDLLARRQDRSKQPQETHTDMVGNTR